MAGDHRAEGVPGPVLDGAGLRVAVVGARWNSEITVRLLDGVRRGLAAAGVADADVTEDWVPGAFELPLAAKAWAGSGRIDAVICLGCVIRGETTHYEAVAGECARGIQDAQLETGIPIAFGALTVENLDQALARSEAPGGHNVGEDAAAVVVEMARLVERLRPHPVADPLPTPS
jgi:6,7-dimethyl-8-ribityllumazine synthase